MKLLLLLSSLLLPGAVSAQSYLAGFEQSLDKCQAALETSEGFFDEGLEQLLTNEKNVPHYIIERGMWRVPGSAFDIVYGVVVDSIGQKRSQCEVWLTNDDEALTPEQLEALSRSFTARMQQQIANGTHERRDLVGIPPLVTFGYGPLKPGPHGCRVIVSLVFDRDGTFFKAVAGEQITHPCSQ